MNPDPVWPTGPAELVLWGQLIAGWLVASYAIAPNTSREAGRLSSQLRLLVAILIAAAAGWSLPAAGTGSSTRTMLALLLGAAVAGTAAGRRLVASRFRHLLAECELVANAAVVLTSAAIVGLGKVGGLRSDAVLRSGKAAAILAIAGAVVFLFRGGTYIVRAVLDKANAAPRVRAVEAPESGSGGTEERAVDLPELNRGRSIGHLERLLMVMVIALGSYEALGFLIAAKGLIRAREFEDRDFAEYFILGSLASAAVALVVGMALRLGIPYLWAL